MKVLSFGEILWDVYPDKKYIGGAPLNFAAHLAKHGEEVYMLSSLGNDDLASDALSQLNEWGISDKYVSILDDKPTGKCLVSLDEHLVPTYDLLEDVAYDYINCGNVTDTYDVLYFGTLALRGAYNCASLKKLLANHRFEEVFVDVNIRPPFYSKDTVRFSVENATVLKISFEELPIVAELLDVSEFLDHTAFAQTLTEKYKNLKCIIVTLGSDGAYALDCKTDAEYACGCAKVKVVSTVGAGDSFSAAFLHQYLRKTDMQLCLEYASKVAGFVVSQYDAVPDYNSKDLL